MRSATFYFITYCRNFLFVCYLFLISFFFSLFITLLGFFKLPLILRIFVVKIWSNLSCYGIRYILNLHLVVHNKSHIYKEPYIYLCKHHSFWESIVLYSVLPNICFVLKQELLNVPILGGGLKSVQSIGIDRKNKLASLKRFLHEGKERLSKKLSLVVFPEGTRVSVNTYPMFYNTAILLAKRTSTKIIFVAHNSGLFWSNQLSCIKPGCIRLELSHPISPTEYNINVLNKYSHKWINDCVKKFGA